MSESSSFLSSAFRGARDLNVAAPPVMLANDLDDGLQATLYDLLVDEGYHVCVPHDPAEGLALLRTGECGAIMIVSLPPESAISSHNWLATLVAAQFSEPLIALRLRKQYALIGLASGIADHESDSPLYAPSWDHLITAWRATLPIPCDLDALTRVLSTASRRLFEAA